MQCPFCRTENRDEREACYHCQKDLTMLRLVVNKAKSHFNTALEYAERNRNEEAIAELHHALDLDHTHINSHVVLGTLYAKTDQLDKAQEHWTEALQIDPRLDKAHQYLCKMDARRKSIPVVLRQRALILILLIIVIASLGHILSGYLHPDPNLQRFQSAMKAYTNHDYASALEKISDKIGLDKNSPFSIPLAQLGEVIKHEMLIQISKAEFILINGDSKPETIQEARHHLTDLINNNPPKTLKRKAEALQDRADRQEQSRMLQTAAGHLAQDQMQKANLEILQLLQLHSLSEENRSKTLEIRAQIVQRSQAIVTEKLTSFAQGQSTRQELDDALVSCQSIQIDPDDSPLAIGHKQFIASARDTLSNTLLALQQNEIDRKRDALVTRYVDKAIDAWDYLDALIALGAEYPQDKTIPNLITQHTKREDEKLSAKIKECLLAEDLENAEKDIDALESLLRIMKTSPKTLSSRTAPFRERIEKTRSTRLLAEFNSNYDSAAAAAKNAADIADDDSTASEAAYAKAMELYAKTIEISPTLLSSRLINEDAKAGITTRVKSAHYRLALLRWEQFIEPRDYRYRSGSIKIKDAEKTIEIYPQVAEHLSKVSYPGGQDDLLFYLAMSQQRVSQPQKAIQTLKRIIELYPKGSITPLAKTHLEKLTQTPKKP